MRTSALGPLIVAVTLAASSAAARNLHFCWAGNDGYTVTGEMAIPEAAMRGMVTERDVTRFAITGYRHGEPIGSWSMTDKAPAQTWHLRFDPLSMSFLMGGSFPGVASQGWNADGNVANCGPGGFGFNSGNFAQDICLDGAWIEGSGIHPATPLLASPHPVDPDCRVQDLSS